MWKGPSEPCRGKFKRDICNLGAGDLLTVLARSKSHLFVNKFDSYVDPLALQCWGEIVEGGAWLD